MLVQRLVSPTALATKSSVTIFFGSPSSRLLCVIPGFRKSGTVPNLAKPSHISFAEQSASTSIASRKDGSEKAIGATENRNSRKTNLGGRLTGR